MTWTLCEFKIAPNNLIPMKLNLVAKQSASTTLQTVIWKALIAQKDNQITLEAAATFAALLNEFCSTPNKAKSGYKTRVLCNYLCTPELMHKK